MGDSIIVRVSDLRAKIQDLRRDGMDYVEVSILEPDEFDGETIPACIQLSGCKVRDTHLWTDYDPVEALPKNEELLDNSLSGIHQSSNLI